MAAPEIVAVARRKRQIERFDGLLTDPSKFDAEILSLSTQGKRSGPEAVWQAFFEENRWIFGAGLSIQFLHSWDPERLEQSVVGASVGSHGKRPDALLRTAGALSALALIEIKTHRTPLLSSGEIRPGAWSVSSAVTEGVAQCQTTVDETVRRLGPQLVSKDENGFERDTTFVCRPRSILIIGSLRQFLSNSEKVNPDKYESFERLRRSLRDPEIVTFDELYERARMVHELGA